MRAFARRSFFYLLKVLASRMPFYGRRVARIGGRVMEAGPAAVHAPPRPSVPNGRGGKSCLVL